MFLFFLNVALMFAAWFEPFDEIMFLTLLSP